MHKSAGVIIKRKQLNQEIEFLMIDRAIFPYGWACPAGHVDKNESFKKAAKREVKEEIGLKISEIKKIYEEYVSWNECSLNVKGHFWTVYETNNYSGEINISTKEVKKYKWVKKSELKNLKLERIWQYWFNKMNLLN